MGKGIASKCKSCGFENKFSFGSGRFNYETDCQIPAINKLTLAFENINYFEHKNTDKYMFYSDEILKGNNFDNNTIDNFDIQLNTVNNYCPNCKEKALEFRIIMFTD